MDFSLEELVAEKARRSAPPVIEQDSGVSSTPSFNLSELIAEKNRRAEGNKTQAQAIYEDSPLTSSLASGALAGIAGMGDLADMLGGAASRFFNPGLSAAMDAAGTQKPSIGGALRSGADWATGVQDSTKIGEGSLPYKISQYGVGGIAGPGKIATNLALGGVSGAGAYAGNEIGGLPGEIIGSIAAPLSVGTAWQGVKNALSPKMLAASELLANAGPEGAAAILAGSVPEGAIGPRTYAEIAGTPSAAAFQETMRKLPGEGANAMEAALVGTAEQPGRALQRENILRALAPELPIDQRGQLIQDLGKAVAATKAKAAGALYDRIDPEGLAQIDVTDAYQAAKGAAAKYLGDDPRGVSATTQKIVEALNPEAAPAMGFKKLQGIKSAAGEEARKFARTGDLAEAKVSSAIKSAITDALDTAATSGKGFTEKQAALYKLADKTYANMTSTYRKGAVGQILKSGDGSEFRALASNVPKMAVRSPESAKQFAKAFGDKPEIMQQAKGHLVDQMLAANSPAKYYGKNQSQFDTLFGGDAKKVAQVVADLKSEQSVSELARRASKGGSMTGQVLAQTSKLIAEGPRKLLKVLGSRGGAAAATAGGFTFNPALAVAGYGASSAAKWLENNIQTVIQKAMVDPELLTALTQKASKETVRAAALKLAPMVLSNMTIAQKGGDLISRAMDKAEIQMEEKKATEAPKLLAASRVPSKKVEQVAADFQPLVKAVIAQESGGNPNARSEVGAQGLMQLMPATGKELFKKAGLEGEYNPNDPQQNVMLGSMYLKQLLEQFDGDIELALTAYHSGPGRVRALLKRTGGNSFADIRDLLGPVGKKYAPSVISRMKKAKTVQI